MRRLSLLTATGLALVLPGCAAEDPAQTTADDTGGTTEVDEESEEAGTGGTTAVSDESSTGTNEEFVPYPARGITITEVYANHGVHVPIYRDGAWVDGQGRNAELIKNRNTLIQALWTVEPGFEPRKIQAKLTLFLPDGTTQVATQNRMVTGDSVPTKLDSLAYFITPAEFMQPGVKFQWELFETAPGYEDLPEPEQVAYPETPGFVGIEQSEMKLRAMLVPVHHDLGADCPAAPEITEEHVEVFHDQLFMQNPAAEVEIAVREPIAYTNSLKSFGNLLGTLAEQRAADGADPAYYYYGVVRPCDGGPDGVGGQAIDIPSFPSQSNAWSRVAVGRWYSGSITSTANTFVHEVGHNQGRRHIYCNGSEGGTDPSYPYEGGDIGVWGFEALEPYGLHSPNNAKDYMTYCGNTWVSDWGWTKVVPFIREITSWETEGVAPDPAQPILVGLVEPHAGEEHWFVTTGNTVGRAPGLVDSVEVETPDGVRTLPTTIGSMGDHDAYNLVIALPEDLEIESIRSMTHLRAGERIPVRSLSVQGQKLMLAP